MIINMSSGGSAGKIVTVHVFYRSSVNVTCTNGKKTYTGITDANYNVIFKLPKGVWTITAQQDGYTSSINVNISEDCTINMSIFAATINITYPKGYSCTAKNGTITLTAPDTSGTWKCVVPNDGAWTISCTNGTNTATKDATISEEGQTLNVTLLSVPVLNSSYPADATVTVKNSVTVKVSIATEGFPKSYSYQWYQGGSKVNGATASSYTFTPSSIGTMSVYCVVTNVAGSVQSRTAKITVNPLYLYNPGNECSSVTGGYSQQTCGSGGGTIEKSSNWMYAAASNTTGWSIRRNGYTTNNKIDLTKYSQLVVRLTCNGNNNGVSGAGATVMVMNQKAPTSFVTNFEKNVSVSYAEYTIDISKLSGSYYIYLGTFAWIGEDSGFWNAGTYYYYAYLQ